MRKTIFKVFVICYIIVGLFVAGFLLYKIFLLPKIIAEYQPVSYNIFWDDGQEIYRELPFISRSYYRRYYKVKDVPVREFIACKKTPSGIGARSCPVLMKHEDVEENWELDLSSAKLILGSHYQLFDYDTDGKSIGESVFAQELCQIDLAVAEQLANGIASGNYMSAQDLSEQGIYFTASEYIRVSNRNWLELQFTLENYENLKWIALVLEYQGVYYIKINMDVYESQYLPCSEEFGAIVDKILTEYHLD